MIGFQKDAGCENMARAATVTARGWVARCCSDDAMKEGIEECSGNGCSRSM